MEKLPTNQKISGTDHFLFALDRKLKKTHQTGYISHMSIHLAETLQVSELLKALRGSEVFCWLSRIAFSAGIPFFQIPKWKIKSNQNEFRIYQHYSDSYDLPQDVIDKDPRSVYGANFVFHIIHHPDQSSTLVFTWHHTIMDAHGAEALIRSLGQNLPPIEQKHWCSSKVTKEPVLQKLNKAKDAKNFMKARSKGPLALLQQPASTGKGQTFYDFIDFSEEESLLIDASSVTCGARFRKSSYYMTASCMALNTILKTRGSTEGTFLIPVPQDQRKRGAPGPILSNQVSFMFYRLEREQLDSLPDSIKASTEQMMDQMRQEMPKTYMSMMELMRRMPLTLFSKLVEAPTKGNYASFFFSDTGDSVKGFDKFLNFDIKDIHHYPPNMTPPGLTIVFTQFRNRLRVVIARGSNILTTEELATLKQQLRTLLIKGSLG